MRGMRENGLPALLDGLRDLDLLDTDAEGEAVRNVLASPLAGLGSGPDIRPLVAALEATLAGDRELHRLPSKFGFLVDDGGAPTLADVAADVRFEWSAEQKAFAISLGGTRREAVFAGFCAADALVVRAKDIAQAAIALQSAQPRRMRALLRDLNPQAAERLFGAQPSIALRATTSRPGVLAGCRTFGKQPVLGLAAPFGRLNSTMLRMVATLADGECGEIRLTPWRTILVPFGAPFPTAPARLPEAGHPALDQAQSAGFITDARDPRLRVAACAGQHGCERGTTSTHADAIALGDLSAAFGDEATPLHVSGCEKGCVKPSRSAITLVGRNGLYDLVRGGHPGDEPVLRGLELAQVRAVLVKMSVPEPA